jgi:hypothetical protein
LAAAAAAAEDGVVEGGSGGGVGDGSGCDGVGDRGSSEGSIEGDGAEGTAGGEDGLGVDLELDDGLRGKGTSRGETDRAAAVADAAEATTATEEDTGDGVFLAAEVTLAVAAATVVVADFGGTIGGVGLGVATERAEGGGGVHAFGELFSRFSRSSKTHIPATLSACFDAAAAAAAAAAAVPAGWRRGMIRPLALALAADRARGDDIVGDPMTVGVNETLLESGTIKTSFRISHLSFLLSSAPPLGRCAGGRHRRNAAAGPGGMSAQ